MSPKSEARKRWRNANLEREREKARVRSAERRAKFPDEGKLAARKHRAVNPARAAEISRRAYYKTRYGITPEERDTMIEAQGGRCKICQEPTTRWHVDHCHSTRRVRGAICGHCNVTLGHAKDSPDRLRRLALYLEGKL